MSQSAAKSTSATDACEVSTVKPCKVGTESNVSKHMNKLQKLQAYLDELQKFVADVATTGMCKCVTSSVNGTVE